MDKMFNIHIIFGKQLDVSYESQIYDKVNNKSCLALLDLKLDLQTKHGIRIIGKSYTSLSRPRYI